MKLSRMLAGTILLASLGIGSCGDEATAPGETAAELSTVAPAGGSVDVAVNAPLVLTFNHAMMAGMEQFIDLHLGDAGGPLVPMGCSWSADRLRVTCQPNQLLQHEHYYTLHVGGGMMDAGGRPVDLEHHGTGAGGQWFMPGSMGGMHGGMPMGGMGTGWQGPHESYGMLFPFTAG